MATRKSQRLGILIIMVVTVIGTIGSFAVMMLATKNQAVDAENQQKALADYEKKYKDYEAKVTKQGDELSATYYPIFSPYAARVGAFDAGSVSSLGKEDIVVGDGAEITKETVFATYYIGWNPKGKVFDQSISGDKLKAPFRIETGLGTTGVITGWKEGLEGMRIGGIRELTIPSDKAYGEAGQGDDIPPNTPLKFIVMAIPAPANIAQPAYPPELMQSLGGN